MRLVAAGALRERRLLLGVDIQSVQTLPQRGDKLRACWEDVTVKDSTAGEAASRPRKFQTLLQLGPRGTSGENRLMESGHFGIVRSDLGERGGTAVA